MISWFQNESSPISEATLSQMPVYKAILSVGSQVTDPI